MGKWKQKIRNTSIVPDMLTKKGIDFPFRVCYISYPKIQIFGKMMYKKKEV
jgi:hypothetical protein